MASPRTPRPRWPARLWPWAAVLLFWGWAAWPLLLWTDRLAFAGKLTTDNIVSAWFYDFVSRGLATGGDIQWLRPLHHPRPFPTATEFPAVMDAVLAAPLGWLLGWPRQWGATQALALLVNGLGGAWLARSLGARGLGTVVAGCLAILCRPVWKDLVMARMNAVWPGFGLMALAGLITAMQARKLPGALLAAALAAVCGALMATIYPPALLLLAPFGLVLVLEGARGASWGRRLLAGLAVAGGLALALDELRRIAATRSGEAGLGTVACPDRWGTLNAIDLWRLQPESFQGLSEPALVLTAWMAAPLALLGRRRLAAALSLLGLVAYGLLSLGPCTEWAEGEPLNAVDWLILGPLLREGWRLAGPLHDMTRFAGVAMLVAAVLTGLGLDALAGKGRLRGLLALALAAALPGHVQWLVLSERLSPKKWHDASVPATALFLRALPAADRGPAIELPFDRKQQFLSVIGAPEPPRLNPLRPGDNPPVEEPFVQGLYRLGFGRSTEPLAPADPRHLRWAFFDPDRCNQGGVPASACEPAVEAALEAALGPSRRLSDSRTRVWCLGEWSDAALELSIPGPT